MRSRGVDEVDHPKATVAALSLDPGFPIPIDFSAAVASVRTTEFACLGLAVTRLPVAVFSIVMGRFREVDPEVLGVPMAPFGLGRNGRFAVRRQIVVDRREPCGSRSRIRAFGRRIAVTTFQGVERSRPFQFGPSPLRPSAMIDLEHRSCIGRQADKSNAKDWP